MSLADVKIPADSSDNQTTNARSALPPVEFSVSKGTTANLLSIRDRQGPQNRLPTAAYRVYFLPQVFSPPSTGTTSTVSKTGLASSAARLAGQKVATLVTTISAPGQGTVLPYSDTVNFGQSGYYYCVGVNRSNVEAPPENMVPAP